MKSDNLRGPVGKLLLNLSRVSVKLHYTRENYLCIQEMRMNMNKKKRILKLMTVICCVILFFVPCGCVNREKTETTISKDVASVSSGDSGLLYELKYDRKTVQVVFEDDKIKIKEGETILKEFDGLKADCFCEEISPTTGLTGYKLYIRVPDAFGADVYYIIQYNGEICVLFGNHADYENGKFFDSYDFFKDLNNDGKEEIIRTVYYDGDGAIKSYVYQNTGRKIKYGCLDDLLGVNVKKLDPRITNVKSMYDAKKNKAKFEYRLKNKKEKSKTQKIDLNKIEFEEVDIICLQDYFKTNS